MKRTLALFGVLVMLGTLLFVNHLPTQAQNEATVANVAVVQRFYIAALEQPNNRLHTWHKSKELTIRPPNIRSTNYPEYDLGAVGS